MTIDNARLEALKQQTPITTSSTPSRMNVFIQDGEKFVLVGKITGARINRVAHLDQHDATLTAHQIVRHPDGTQEVLINTTVSTLAEGVERIKGWAIMTLINTPTETINR